MTIAFDAAVEFERTLSTDPQTWTHTPVGTPKGIAVGIIHQQSATDHVLTVTYGGVAMTEVLRAADSTGSELGAAEWWFLGSSIPTGAQTVSVDFGSATNDNFLLVSVSVTATGDTEVVDSDSINENQSDPSVTLQYGGRTCLSLGALMSSQDATTGFTENANCTRLHDMDLGSQTAYVFRQTTVGASDFAIGGTAVSGTVAYVAIALSESVGSATFAFDAAAESVAAANPQDWTHTPVGAPKGAVVLLNHLATSADLVTGVTYGGVAMTRQAYHVNTSANPRTTYIYVLGESVPTGAQTVSVARTQGTTTIHGVSVTLTASRDLEVVDTDGLTVETADPQVTLQYQSRNGLALVVLASGADTTAEVADLGTMTRIHDHDFGTNTGFVSRQTTLGSTDFTIGYTAASFGTALSAVVLAEVDQEIDTVVVTGSGGSSAPRGPSFLASALRAARTLPDLVRVLVAELPKLAQAVVCYEPVARLTYGTTVRPSGRVSRANLVQVADAVDWTMEAPGEPREGVELTFDIWNDSGVTMGAITWAPAYELTDAFTNPGSGKHRMISFIRMPDTKWREVRRSANDLD